MFKAELYKPGEPSFEFWQEHGWQYRARFLTAVDIVSEIEAVVQKKEEQHENEADTFFRLISLPPYLKLVLQQDPQAWSTFFEQSLTGIENLYLVNGLIRNSNQLMTYLEKPPTYTHIDLNHVPVLTGAAIVSQDSAAIPFNINSVIQNFPEDQSNELKTRQKAGFDKGVDNLLSVLSNQEIPLMRWRKELGGVHMNLKKSHDGGEVGTLPTKLDGVEARFYYAKNRSHPEIGLVIDTI